MNLSFSTPTPVTQNGESYFIEDAPITDEFWTLWRGSKDELAAQGISVIKKKDDMDNLYWAVRRITKELLGEDPIPQLVVPVLLSNSKNLLKYQITPTSQIVSSLLSNKISIDASDTGTGKTYMNLKAAKELGYTPGIICTKNGIPDWIKVCRFIGVRPLFIINWESAKSAKFPYIEKTRHDYTGKYSYKWKIPKSEKILLIFDEVHKANNKGTQNQDLLLAARYIPICGLSATLAESLPQLRAIGSLLGLFEIDKFPEWLKTNGLIKDKYKNWKSLTDKKDMIKVSKFIFPSFGTRINKDNLPDFPDIQNIAKLYPIKEAKSQNEHYKELLGKIKEFKNSDSQGKLLALTGKYRELAELNKVDLLVDLARDHRENGHSVIIFVNYRETLRQISEKLKCDCLIHGGQTGKQGEALRLKNIDDFQKNSAAILIATIAAGGTSISLHDLHGEHPRVSLICPTYNAKELIQVLGRTHRAGAKTKATNYLIYGENTIEEKVFNSVVSKMNNINLLNDGDLAKEGIFE